MEIVVSDQRSAKAELAQSLAVTLGSAYVMLVKTAGMHWNVKGPDFSEYHEFFSDIYGDIDGMIDPTAENILKLGFDAPASMTEMVNLSKIQDGLMSSDEPVQMCRELLAANEIMLMQIAETFSIANALNEQGIANFMAERDNMHKKWGWQLRAICGMQQGGNLGKAHTASHNDCPYCDGFCECASGECMCPDYCSCSCRNHSMIAAPAPKKDQIKGSDKNKPGSAAGGKKIVFSDKVETALKNKVAEHNEKAPAGRKATLGMLKAVYRRGAGAFSSSHRPGKTRDQWAMARVNAYLKLLKSGSPANANYKQDNDLLPAKHPKSTNSSDSIVASAALEDELTVEILDEEEYITSEHAIVAMAEYSGLGYEIIPALKSAWIRGVNENEDPFSRARELAVDLYDSRDADLLPRTEK